MEEGYFKRRILTPEQAYVKIRHYCAFQERTHKEVKTKLAGYGISWQAASEMTSRLIEEGFLNEERFAKMFAGGKFRIKGWGRKKIEIELKKRGVADYSIKKALLAEIDKEEYEKMALRLIEKKWKSLKGEGETEFVKQSKTRQYLLMRGYENDVISRGIKLFLCKD